MNMLGTMTPPPAGPSLSLSGLLYPAVATAALVGVLEGGRVRNIDGEKVVLGGFRGLRE